MKKLAKIIRVITIAPVMAILSLIVLFAFRPDEFSGTWNFICAVFFLTVLPVLAYPLQPLIPGFRGKGREGQRKLAMLMAVLGYVAGVSSVVWMNISGGLLMFYLTYLISGILIVISNKLIKVRASGHACGVCGPIAFLVYFLGAPALCGAVVLAAVYWASLKLSRHTWPELISGSLIPIAAMFASAGIVSLI